MHRWFIAGALESNWLSIVGLQVVSLATYPVVGNEAMELAWACSFNWVSQVVESRRLASGD